MSATKVQSSAPIDNPIISGPIWKQLLTFFFPILLGSFFQQMYNTVDAIIVGQFVGTAALAAVGGSTNVLISFLVNLFMGISSGATVIIAQQYGAKRYDDVGRSVHTAMALTLVAGIAITVLGFFLSKPALILMGTPDDILSYATDYMQIYFLGSVASFIYNIGSGIMRAIGDNKRPLYFLIAACMTNIVLDLLFVLVLRLEVVGVALATISSQIVAAALVLVSLIKTTAPHRLIIQNIRIDLEHLKSILRIGIPSGLQSNMYTISNIALQDSVNAFGTTTVAAWTAYGKIDSFYWMIIGAFGISITTFVGQNYGAGKIDRVKKSVKTCLIMALSASAFISILFCGFGGQLLRLFTTDAEVLELGKHIISVISPFFICYVCVEILSGTIRGTGNSLIPMILTCVGVCVLRVAWVFFILPLYRHFDMVLISYPISWIISSTMFIVYYTKSNWLKSN